MMFSFTEDRCRLPPPGRCILALSLLTLVLLSWWPLHGFCQTFGSGAFTKVSLIEKELKRGVSRKSEVRTVLGTPKGFGAALLPLRLPERLQREVWYYEDIELKDAKFQEGTIHARFRQQVLVVFFDGDVFDGYMWFTNAMNLGDK